MIASLILLAVAALSVRGGYLALQEPSIKRRTASLVAAVALITSVGAFIRLVHAYNVRPIELFARNPMAGLAPWDLLALGLSSAAIIPSVWGVKKARLPLLTSSVLMFSYTLLTLNVWD
jgi:hypothetical protein